MRLGIALLGLTSRLAASRVERTRERAARAGLAALSRQQHSQISGDTAAAQQPRADEPSDDLPLTRR